MSKFDIKHHNDPEYDAPFPWNTWDSYAGCWVCRHCGAASGYQMHNEGCFVLEVEAEVKAPLTQSREDAVWAATYVRVLSAIASTNPARDQGIHHTAEMLADPTQERMTIARRAACAAIVKLRRRW